MARTNAKPARYSEKTAEGAIAARITDAQALRRSVLSCLLWEDLHYEDGVSVAQRIETLAAKVPPATVAALAIEARREQNLRHVPLLLLRSLIRHGRGTGGLVAETIEKVISRPDELNELVALYWSDKSNKKMLPAQMKKGLARAFAKFNEYSLQKYNADAKVRLRDVLFLCHAKPEGEAQTALWKRLAENELATPDTWETVISGAKSGGLSKKEAWEKVIDTWITE